MNGSAIGTPGVVDIRLRRGPAGLGFNIVGGVDQQYLTNGTGIYVAKIKEDGAAALDGRLQEGDKILEINGHKLENLSHSSAVELFRAAGDDVLLRVQQKLPHTANGPANSPPDDHWLLTVGAIGLVLAALFVSIRYAHTQRLF